MSRKTATASEEAHDQLFQWKREGESTSEFFMRCAEILEQHDGDQDVDLPENILTTDHIPDIVNTGASRTADEVEERLSRR